MDAVKLEGMMVQFPWGPLVIAGLFIVIFPLTAISTMNAAARNSVGTDGESTGTFVVLPAKGYNSPRVVLRFLEANAQWMKPAEVDKALWRLLALQNKRLKSYQSKIASDAINPKINRYSPPELTGLRTIKEENIRRLVKDMLADGFMLSSTEGMVYPEIDFPRISARFGFYASAPVAGYLRIMARESAQHFASDAALLISPDILARRIIAIETFFKENWMFPRHDDLAGLARKYVSAYLLGLDNTPAFNGRTRRLDGRFEQSYHQVVRIYPGTRLAGYITKYLSLLSQNDFQRTKPVLDFAVKTTADF